MRRRELLKTAAAAALTARGAVPLARADRAKTLVFVGVADLSVLDPVISGNRPTRNYAYLVFDRTVRFRLKRPFPHLPAALAGPGGNVPAIMPERLAKESPFKPVAEIIGSGPTAS